MCTRVAHPVVLFYPTHRGYCASAFTPKARNNFSDYKRQWYQQNKLAIAQRKKLYDQQHAKEISEYAKKYRAKHHKKWQTYTAQKKQEVLDGLRQNPSKLLQIKVDNSLISVTVSEIIRRGPKCESPRGLV